MQVLLLAQSVQERSLLFEEGLPRREEHGAADVQPDPLPVIPAGGVDDRTVTDALRRRPAGFGRAGGGGRRALSRLDVFVVVVVIIVIVVVAVVVAAVVRRQRGDVLRFPLVVRRRCHLETAARHEMKTSEGVRLSPLLPRLLLPVSSRAGSAHSPAHTQRSAAEATGSQAYYIREALSK